MLIMWKLVFTKKAEKAFLRLNKNIQKRIKNKLGFYFSTWNPLQYAEKLTDPKLGTYRFRIGRYRLVFDVDEKWKLIILLVIDIRCQVYKDI